MKPNKFTSLLSGLFLLVSASQSTAQTTRTVCTSGCNFTTIQAAMTAASSGDIILLNVTGAFTEKNIVIPEKNLTVRGLGKTTTILQSAATAANASGGRIFSYVDPAGAGSNEFTVEDMTIQNAYAPVDAGNQAIGGVLYAKGPKGWKVSFNNVRMYNNQTQAGASNNSGGACIYISATPTVTPFTYNADLSLTNCDFESNYLGNPVTNSWGACLSLLGSPARLTVDNCNFKNNTAYNGAGVIYCGSNWIINIKNSLFDNNTYRVAGEGGCFKGTSGNWNFDNCLFSNNKALLGNGYGGVFTGAGAKFKSCTFANNQAVKGGAIYRPNSGFAVNGNLEMQIINCTFSGNQASSTGRSIHYGNAASASSFPLVLVNSIITNGGGTAPSEFHFVLPYSQLATNLKNYCNSISTENATPGTTPVFDFTSSNTTLGLSTTLASNGGNIQSLALINTSTLINAGTNVTGSTYDISIKDQRNYSRHDGTIDVGSYEYNGLTDDAVKPVITYTALGNTLATTDRTINATITDANGVYWFPQTTDLRPRIYFRKNSGSWNNAVGTLSTGNGLSGNWNFTISSAAMGGLVNGDQVNYYVIAQDISTNANIISSPANVVATSVNAVTAAPVAASYLIGSTLPIKLTSFTAKTSGSNALLDWAVSEEINVAHYALERSTTGSSWSNIGILPAAHSNQYSFTDPALATGTYYYRLRVVDLDGRVTYSESRVIKILGSDATFSIMGSQVSNGMLQVAIHRKTALSLFDTNGKLVWIKQFVPGVQRIDVSSYAKGIYFLKADGSAQKIQLQ